MGEKSHFLSPDGSAIYQRVILTLIYNYYTRSIIRLILAKLVLINAFIYYTFVLGRPKSLPNLVCVCKTIWHAQDS